MPRIFTTNSKTILSLDFDRISTCDQICDYCYVGQLEKIYKAYKPKIERNELLAKDNPKQFASDLNAEYRKLRKSKAVLGRADCLPSGGYRARTCDLLAASQTLSQLS